MVTGGSQSFLYNPKYDMGADIQRKIALNYGLRGSYFFWFMEPSCEFSNQVLPSHSRHCHCRKGMLQTIITGFTKICIVTEYRIPVNSAVN